MSKRTAYPASSRNRHTGRVNFYKQNILDRGGRFEVVDGTVYYEVQAGLWSQVSRVRDFSVED